MAPKNSEYLEIAHQRAIEKKTHVSFPQVKYPSLRDEGFRDPVQWITGKAMDDGAEGLWRVHNGLYDLSDFMYKHPGGSEWLELTKNTDITEAFECHHLNPSVNKVLEKYLVRTVTTPRNSPFTFNDDGFYRTLKRAVVEELKTIPKTGLTRTTLITDGLFASLLINSVLSIWCNDFYVATACHLIASLSLAWLTVASHNFIHKPDNWRMYYFNFSMWSYRDFRISHALSHHLFPNTLMDLEVSGFEPIILWNPRREKTVFQKMAIFTEMLLYPFLFSLNFTKKIILYFTRKGYFNKHARWHDWLCFLLPLLMYLISGCTPYEAIIGWVRIILNGSFFFCWIGFNAAHHHPKIFKDGDQVRDISPDWGIHELEAVMDRNDINGNLFTVLTHFGDHSLHHLFPTLDHVVLPHLYPVFLEHCKKFRGNFRVTSSFELFLGQIQQIVKTEPNLIED